MFENSNDNAHKKCASLHRSGASQVGPWETPGGTLTPRPACSKSKFAVSLQLQNCCKQY